MGFGTAVRQRLGPLEPFVSDAYRSRFIDLDDFTRTVASLARPKRIVEIGCGDGAVADRMCREFPETEYLGLDIAPRPGRLFAGDRRRAEFRSQSSSELLVGQSEPFDLVMLVDVFHHLPEPVRLPTLRDLDALCRAGGLIIVKDWERAPTVSHLACYVSDRWVSGDATFITPRAQSCCKRSQRPSRMPVWSARLGFLRGAATSCSPCARPTDHQGLQSW